MKSINNLIRIRVIIHNELEQIRFFVVEVERAPLSAREGMQRRLKHQFKNLFNFQGTIDRLACQNERVQAIS